MVRLMISKTNKTNVIHNWKEREIEKKIIYIAYMSGSGNIAGL